MLEQEYKAAYWSFSCVVMLCLLLKGHSSFIGDHLYIGLAVWENWKVI